MAVLGGTADCLVAMALGEWLLPFAYAPAIMGFDVAMFNWFSVGWLWALSHGVKSAASTSGNVSVTKEATA